MSIDQSYALRKHRACTRRKHEMRDGPRPKPERVMSSSADQRFLQAVATRLSALRAAKGLSRRAFAEPLGLSSRTLEKYEYAQREVSAVALARLRQVYGVDVNWLLTGDPADATQVGQTARGSLDKSAV